MSENNLALLQALAIIIPIMIIITNLGNIIDFINKKEGDK